MTRQLPLNLVDGEHAVVLFDLETTGLRPKRDRVIQIAAKVRRAAAAAAASFDVLWSTRPICRRCRRRAFALADRGAPLNRY